MAAAAAMVSKFTAMVSKLTAFFVGLVGLVATFAAGLFALRRLRQAEEVQIRAELIEKARAVNDHRRAQVESQARIIKQEVDGLGDDRAAIAAALDE